MHVALCLQGLLLGLLDGQALTVKEWKAAAEDISRATFFRIKRQLVDSGKVICYPQDGTWAKVEAQTGGEEDARET